MLVLTIRTDKPEAELGLYNADIKLAYSTWMAHRQLAETIHAKIKELLESHGHSLPDIQGIVVFKGPGSFTGLRIGISVANTLADSLRIPLAAEIEPNWIITGITRLQRGDSDDIAIPSYGNAPHTTAPKR